MSSELQRDIVAFEQMLPELRQKYGSVWALFVSEKFEGVFQSFKAAAEAAVLAHADRPFLIRHTDNLAADFPFLVLEH